MDAHHRHAAMISTRGNARSANAVAQVSSFPVGMQLNDDRFLDIVPEPLWGGPTAVMSTILPCVILQQQVNNMSTRHIQPDGHGAFNFEWTHFGFADDAIFHGPYCQRHVNGVPRLLDAQPGRIDCEADDAVFRTKLSGPSTVFMVGRSLDRFVQTPEGWRYAQRVCVYDSEMISNSIIYPI